MRCTPTAIASLGAITMFSMASVDELHYPHGATNVSARISF